MTLLALLLAAQAPPEPAWESLGSHGGIEIAVDPASARRVAEGRVRIRIRGIAAAAGADGIRTATGTIEVDCAAGTATALDLRGLDADGRLMLNAIVPEAERRAEPIRPDSPNAAVRARVCGRQDR